MTSAILTVRHLIVRAAAAILTTAVAGCGGGSDPPPVPDSFPELVGAWTYTLGGNLSGSVMNIVIESDGQIWGQPGYSYMLGASRRFISQQAEKGQLSRSATGAAVGTVTYLSPSGRSTVAVTVAAQTSPSRLSYAVDNGLDSRQLAPTFVTASEVGAWRSKATTPAATDAEATLTVTSDRKISGTDASGCSFSGDITPVTEARYFKLGLSSINGSCASTTLPADARGVAFVVGEGAGALLYVLWHSPDRRQFFWSAGGR